MRVYKYALLLYRVDYMKLNISNLFSRKKSGKVLISAINMRWKGQMHSMDGIVPEKTRFTISIPFQNKTQDSALERFAALKEKFKAQEVPPVIISSIKLSDPFKLVSVEPKLPITVRSGERIEISITIDAPDYAYSGPLTVTIDSPEASMIKVQLNKVILSTKLKKAEIENSGVILNIPPNGVFKNSVQVYKAMSYGDSASKVTISEPFEFIESDPKLPFKIDNPNSYIVTFFIKAPETDYAGPMEIKVE
jgi:hypothetical protein